MLAFFYPTITEKISSHSLNKEQTISISLVTTTLKIHLYKIIIDEIVQYSRWQLMKVLCKCFVHYCWVFKTCDFIPSFLCIIVGFKEDVTFNFNIKFLSNYLVH